ncbi:FadR/GntR family transcriptional regulator [Kaistia dalseonensis]|uniref:DNA-binding FadR family transcriptional regulator n=1 Tax=Kaistia dalseonensis TaxID=410840 RepID=A0ABU0H8U6_9HYPH|nr:FadR/GntR family transcriptional regulator [Kaistia dalseonensis]MCX5496133.1 FadR/GntR family transcriptional regulator [Kaistia dalseonensis]MDQ0438742.1 DNA-binding FadR family transcriptional regulator [Kaistia dalseonensis]
MAAKERATLPKAKPRVHHHVVRTLALRLLRGEWAEGSALPPEMELCRELEISRSALREAIKVLGGKGLVSVRPRTGTAVRPRDEWNRLDPDLLRWSMDLEPDLDLVFSLIEARQSIEPAAARLAAARATEEDIARLDDAYRRMVEALADSDFQRFNEADTEFHRHLLRASHNVVFHQMATTIDAALAYSFRMTIQRAREPGGSLALHGDVVERIRARDTDGAQDVMIRLLNLAVVDLGLANRP